MKILKLLQLDSGVLSDIGTRLDEINQKLDRIIDILTPQPAVDLRFTAVYEDATTKENITTMQLRDDQKVSLSIQPVDAKGKPAAVDGVPVWASSDETVLTVSASTDGMSAVAVSVAMGSARVSVTADADLGEGVTPITGILDVTVTPGQAVSISITAGTPESQ